MARFGSRSWRLALAGAVAVGTCLLGPQGPGAEVRPLTLYERTGRAPLVVRGEVLDGEHRFAVIRTLDLIKCTIPERPAAEFRIAYKLDSFLRRPWEDKIAFLDGERVILFLRKFTKEDGDQPEGDLYTLMWGAQGKHLLPVEGEEAQSGAVRTFAAILAEADLDRQASMLRREILSSNPFLAESALEEVLRQGLGDPQMIPDLLGLLANSRETLRVQSMRLMTRIFSDEKIAGRALANQQDLADRIRARAALDTSAALRVEGIRALTALGGDDLRAFLQRLAKDDPSQLVRYEAKKSLMGLDEGS